MIPIVKANSSESLKIKIKTSESVSITLWTGDGWGYYGETSSDENGEKSAMLAGGGLKKAECMMEYLGWGTIEAALGVIPGAGCIISAGKSVYSLKDYGSKDLKSCIGNTFWNMASTVAECAVSFSGVGGAIKFIATAALNARSNYQSVKECMGEGARGEGDVNVVMSLDPNEMVGPTGHGDENWILPQSEMPYTIFFENKSSATAPAHVVTISDTLDADMFDFDDFGFGSFGWGDTILSPLGDKLKEFTRDVDLRPETELIVRVQGKLDTLQGIAQWEIVSLNPETMEEEEDPFVGFLPANKVSPEGEGFVSFVIGVKDELPTQPTFENQATIIFDANAPILTNTYVNYFDSDNPQSQILPIEYAPDSVQVCWEGNDASSGIKSYTVYIGKNGGEYHPWIENTEETCAWLKADRDTVYSIYSLATDNVGHTELFNAASVVEYIHVGLSNGKLGGEVTLYPNPAQTQVLLRMNRPFGKEQHQVGIYDLSGRLIRTHLFDSEAIKTGVILPLDNLQPGQYILQISGEDLSAVKRLTIK